MKKSFIYIILIALCLNMVFLFYIYFQYQQKDTQKKESFAFVTLVNKIILSLQNSENCQRGYLLTQDNVYLDKYYTNIEQTKKLLDRLFEFVDKNTSYDYKAYMKKIKLYKKITINKLDTLVKLTKDKNTQHAIYMMKQYYGKKFVDKLEHHLNKMITLERKEFQRKKNEFDTFIKKIYILMIFISLISILVFLMLIKQSKEIDTYQKELEEYLDLINTHVLFSITDLKGNIIDISDALCSLSAYRKDELLGKNHNILRDPDTDTNLYKELWDTIQENKIWQGEIKNKNKNNKPYWLYCTIAPKYNKYGEKIGYIGFSHNLTDKKELELQEKYMVDSSKMIALGEMIGNIAHQWRQPLSAISVQATGALVQSEVGTLSKEQLHKIFDNINTNAQYLSETIDTFSNFIKVDKEIKDVVIQERIDTALNIIDTTLKSNHIKLIKDINYRDLIVTSIVFGELPQVLINIINNAKDALLEKKVENPWIKISLKKKSTYARITIEDNAGGIPFEILPKIFEPYFTTKHKSKGTGLGLYMSYKIVVQSLKGQLYIKNTKNGAKFYIEIPIQREKEKFPIV